jgi:CubicO group peptidase (beta-lactamase class C family)
MAIDKPRAKKRHILLGVLGVTALAGIATYLSDKVYYDRYVALFTSFAKTGAQLESYEPVEAVVGNYQPFTRTTPALAGISDAAVSEARTYAQNANSNAFMVWRDGKIIEETYFQNNRADKPIISRSLAKPFMAAAIGRALALGKLKSLDQPISDYLTEWKNDPKRSKILIRHLLDNRTGLLAQDPVYGPFEIRNRSYLHPRHEDVLLKEYPLTNDPGTRYDYSQANGDLVALVIERATGRRYAEFLSTEVFKPIGARGGSIWVNREGGVAHSGCCMLVPAEDFLRLGVLYMQDGVWNGQRLLPDGFVTQMRTGTPQYEHAGMSVYLAGKYVERRGFSNPDGKHRDTPTIHKEPYLAADLFLFDGNAHQVVYIIPSAKMVILRTGPRPAKVPEFDNTILANTLLRGLTSEIEKAALVAQAK